MERLYVEKYGGSSVATPELIKKIAESYKPKIENGAKFITTLSAMGKTTDNLIALAKEISKKPNPRELDMLLATGEQVSVALFCIACAEIGIKAISLNAFQAGIKSDENFNSAIIKSIDKQRLKKYLEEYDVIAVTGFQGITEDYDLTTLGRGGSDTTAVAIAAVMGVDCSIYSDVAGVYSIDPKLFPKAKKLKYVSYDEMLEMAFQGAKVLHSRSVEIAKKYKVKIYCGKTLSKKEGTYVVDENHILEAPLVTGASFMDNQTRATVYGIPKNFELLQEMFKKIAEQKLNVDMISVIANTKDMSVSLTIVNDKIEELQEIIREYFAAYGDFNMSFDRDNVKISIIGVGMRNGIGAAYRFFNAMKNVPIKMITTSEIKISCLISSEFKEIALESLAKEFNLLDENISNEND